MTDLANDEQLAVRPGPRITPTPVSAWNRMRYWVIAHAVDDFYQGLVPAAIPFFVLERHYSYAAASGLALAATLGSALPQPLLGLIADRWRLLWMAPAGLAAAGIGAGLAGLVPGYWLVWTMLLISGLGVAAFHPAAGRDARRDAGDSATAMSLFAAGGSVGFFLAPALVTPALVSAGLGATAWFIPPAVIMGFVLWRYQLRQGSANSVDRQPTGNDRWGAFSILVAVEVVRSAVYFGMNTFIALYLIDHLDVSAAVGGVGLAMFLGGGVIGTLLGGRISDRLGMIATIRVGSIVAIPAFVALRTCPQPWIALALAAVVGITVNIPFAVLVKLGQDYLPTRPGTAAGVTLGLAVSIGGFFVPLLGVLADHHGPQAVLTTLCVAPILAIVLAFLLPHPARE
ncbi:Putative membrane efflux protein [Mycobacteroides abscessus subsp. bolletii]|uniref:MFS transporter n=1 Tax=Mycobacteroides abscessus TaxID=36809 RepID=UPI0009A87E1D|nr:MFS transporter [Mycobacteroides abscessus]SKG87942.1 Putative membrane efflux protein [Mycobacteroides abscessus subsp. bolletii]SKG98375.1 Putative membrane efflux protein [Mycobacteroides abscessus subsp. bolletii]